MPILIDPFSFTSSARFIICFLSIKLAAFYSSPVLCKLSEISLSVIVVVRFIRCFLCINIVAFDSFYATIPFLSFSALLFISSCVPCTHIPPYPISFPSEGNLGSSWVCWIVWYFRMTFCSYTMLPFMGVVEVQPLVLFLLTILLSCSHYFL
jgi:hypothetical protein